MDGWMDGLFKKPVDEIKLSKKGSKRVMNTDTEPWLPWSEEAERWGKGGAHR